MRKKLTGLSLAFAMMLTLAACGDSSTPNGTVTNVNTTPEVSVETSVETSVEASVDASVEEPAEEVVEVAASEVVGVNNGLKYENAFFGIACTLDDNWVLNTQEEIEANNRQTANMLSEDYADLLANASNLTDMFATNVNGVDTLNIAIQKLSKLETLAITEQANLEASAPMIEEALSQMGLTNIETRISTTVFAGVEHPVLILSGVLNEYNVYEQLVCIKKDNYLANVTVCSWLQDDTDEYLALFTELK